MRGRLLKIFAIFLCVISFSISFAQQSKINPNNVAVTIGSEIISKQQVFKLFVQRYPKETLEVIRELVVQRIVRLESKKERLVLKKNTIFRKVREDLKVAKQEAQKNKQSLQQYLQAMGLNQKEFYKRSYKKWKYGLALKRLVRLYQFRQGRAEARHILLPTRKKAQATLQKLNQGADFATLARTESLSKVTGKKGGRLPTIYPGYLPEPLEREIFRLRPYQIGEIVKSPWGFHIVQVLEKKPGYPNAKWAEVESQILKSLKEDEVSSSEIQRWLKHMESNYNIAIKFR